MSPVAVHLEDAVHRWLIAMLGLPESCAAATVTRAQMANFTALAAARHTLLARVGWNAERDGLFGAPPIPVVVSEQSHSTVGKALAMLGLGRARVTTVRSDAQGRVDAAALRQAVTGPAIVCLQAGNVNTGAFDDFTAVMPHLRRQDAWVHIDGAFGLWAAASPAYAHLMAGAAEADSWATDGHKILNVPYDCGLAFVRNAAALGAARPCPAPTSLLPRPVSRSGAPPMPHGEPGVSSCGWPCAIWATMAWPHWWKDFAG